MQSELRERKKVGSRITLYIQESNKAVHVKVSLFAPRTKPMLSNNGAQCKTHAVLQGQQQQATPMQRKAEGMDVLASLSQNDRLF